MRCSDATRELSVPTDLGDRSALEAHLAECSACAAFAQRAQAFDRLWARSRPAEPPSPVFAEVWARVVQTARAPERPARLTLPGRVGRLGAGLAALAAAAAVLVSSLPLFRHAAPPEPTTQVGARPAVAVPVAEIHVEPGEILVIHLDDRGARIAHRPPPQMSDLASVSADWELVNLAQALQ